MASFNFRGGKIDLLICKFSCKVDANFKLGHLCPFLYICKFRDLLYIRNHCKCENTAIAKLTRFYIFATIAKLSANLL